MNVKPRGGAPIDLIVLHDPEGANTAQELYNYLQHIDAGYHSLDDDTEEIICANDDQVVEGAGGVNMRSLNLCFVPGRAVWTRAQWLQHDAAIRRGAARAAIWSQLHGIPLVHLTPGQVGTPGTKGVCTHGDVTLAGYKASEGHTDPGLGFPMDVFLAYAKGGVPDTEDEVDMPNLIAAPGWQTTDKNRPAAVELIAKEKRVSLINHAQINQPPTIPSNTDIISWYETFDNSGAKKGFVVLARSGPGLNGNPAFEFTWKKK